MECKEERHYTTTVVKSSIVRGPTPKYWNSPAEKLWVDSVYGGEAKLTLYLNLKEIPMKISVDCFARNDVLFTVPKAEFAFSLNYAYD